MCTKRDYHRKLDTSPLLGSPSLSSLQASDVVSSCPCAEVLLIIVPCLRYNEWLPVKKHSSGRRPCESKLETFLYKILLYMGLFRINDRWLKSDCLGLDFLFTALPPCGIDYYRQGRWPNRAISKLPVFLGDIHSTWFSHAFQLPNTLNGHYFFRVRWTSYAPNDGEEFLQHTQFVKFLWTRYDITCMRSGLTRVCRRAVVMSKAEDVPSKNWPSTLGFRGIWLLC